MTFLHLPSLTRTPLLANLWAVAALGTILSGCDAIGVGSNADDSPSMVASPPALLMQARMVDQTQLRPVVSLTDAAGNSTRVPMQSMTDNAWSGQVTVAPNHQYSLSVIWVELFNNQDLELARYDETFSVNDQGRRVDIAANDYNFDLDADGDGQSNLFERENQTDPFVNANTGENLQQPTDTVEQETDPTSDDPSTDSTDNPDSDTTDNPDSDTTDNPDTDSTDSEPDSDTTDELDTDSTDSEPDSDTTDELDTDSTDSEPDSDTTDELDTDSTDDEPGSDSTDDPEPDSTDSEPDSDTTDDDPETEPVPDTTATVIIPRIARIDAPVIDGEDVAIDFNGSFTGEWASAVQFDLSGNPLTMSHLMIDDGADALDGNNYRRWAAMHDGKYLYLLVVVDDDGQRETDSEKYWNDDSLELFIDGDNSKLQEWGDNDDFHLVIPLQESGATGKTKQKNVYDLGYNALDNIPEIRIVTGPGLGPRGVRRPRFENDVYEIRIDLDSVSVVPGQLFGFELQVNDDDDGEQRDSKWGWFHPSREGNERNDTTYLDPSAMGTVVLE